MWRLSLVAAAVLALAAAALAETYVVTPDGTGDFPTIQAAIDACVDGDVIELTDGVFTGDGNRDIDFLGKRITVRSQSYAADACVIDCEGSPTDPHRGFHFHHSESHYCVLRGVTITGGFVVGDWPGNAGGAVRCDDGASPRFVDCAFRGNSARWGGAVYCHESSLEIDGCTFVGNSASIGGAGMVCFNSSSPTVDNTIIAFSTQGEAIFCDDGSTAILSCSDLYGNAGGDWGGTIADYYFVNGNFSADPCFCDMENDDYHLWNYSPCDQEVCGLIGALPVGCWDPQVAEDDAATSLARECLLLSRVSPNPSSAQTWVGYWVPPTKGTPIALRIYDCAGHLVRTLIDDPHPSGPHALCWDGTHESGARASSGIYWIRLSAGHQSRTERLVIIR